MKKGLKVLLCGIMLMVFSGCGKSAQDVFIDDLSQLNSTKKYNEESFSMKIDDMDLGTTDSSTADSSDEQAMNQVKEMIKQIKFSGNYVVDNKNKAVDYSMDINMLGLKVPMDFMIVDEDFYLSGDFFQSLMAEMASFSDTKEPLPDSINNLKGKYIKISKEELKKQAGDAAESLDFKNLTENSQGEIMGDFLKTLEKDSFKKKDDVVSHTFDKKEMFSLIKYMKKHGDKATKETLKGIEMNKDEMKTLDKIDMNMKLSINDKTKKMVYKITIASKDEKKPMKMGFSMTMNSKKSTKKVEVPKAENTLTMDDLEKMSPQPDATTGSVVPQTPATTESSAEQPAVTESSAQPATTESTTLPQ